MHTCLLLLLLCEPCQHGVLIRESCLELSDGLHDRGQALLTSAGGAQAHDAVQGVEGLTEALLVNESLAQLF